MSFSHDHTMPALAAYSGNFQLCVSANISEDRSAQIHNFAMT